jgi:alpha-tubulin suppressor-like RCC1 family protein
MLAVGSMMTISGCVDEVIDPLATARVEIVSGGAQNGVSGSALSQPVTVRVLSGEGTPLPRIAVHWIVLEGAGRVEPDSTVTDANGIATVQWTLGGVPGVQALLARTRTASARIEATATVIFSDVSAGFRHTCALTAGGSAFCWGLNDRGQLGVGTVSATERPALVAGGATFRMISSGWFHTCALDDNGAVYCWGDNSVGQLGSPGPTTALPRRVTGISGAVQWIAAGYQHTCASTATGATFCWGVDDFGQLGSGRTTPACFNTAVQRCTATPQGVAGTLMLSRVAAGEFHSCAVALDGALYCWGWNSNGQIGNLGAANAIFDVPTRTISNRGYAFVDAGARHNCAVTSAEVLECWGRNVAGEIGITAGTALAAPNPMPSTQQFRDADAGVTHSCALSSDQRAFCWGSLLGNGAPGSSSTPVQVALQGPVTAITAGGDHACAVVQGSVYCWGSNSNGQLGVAGVTLAYAPFRVEVGQ